MEKDVWLDFLSSKAYDANDHYLVVNEFQAYLFQQDRESVEGFQALTISRMKARGGAAASLAERLLSAHPRSFLDAFDALDGKLRAARRPAGRSRARRFHGKVIFLLPAQRPSVTLVFCLAEFPVEGNYGD